MPIWILGVHCIPPRPDLCRRSLTSSRETRDAAQARGATFHALRPRKRPNVQDHALGCYRGVQQAAGSSSGQRVAPAGEVGSRTEGQFPADVRPNLGNPEPVKNRPVRAACDLFAIPELRTNVPGLRTHPNGYTEPPMTTAAIADGVVAVDTQCTGGNYAVRVQKLVRLPDGGVAVGCGTWSVCYPGLQWLAGGEKGDAPEIEGAMIAIVRPDHSIWIAEGTFPAYPIIDRTYALGCGADLARKALADGADPVQAVTEACELDAVSSAPILSMAVEPVEFSGPEIHAVKRKRK